MAKATKPHKHTRKHHMDLVSARLSGFFFLLSPHQLKYVSAFSRLISLIPLPLPLCLLSFCHLQSGADRPCMIASLSVSVSLSVSMSVSLSTKE